MSSQTVFKASNAATGVIAKLRALLRITIASQLRRNTLAGAGGAVVGGLIAAISYPLYLHFLGYEQFGLWLAVSVVLSFSAFGHLGLAPAVAATIAEEYARGDLIGIRKTVSSALLALTLMGALAVTGVLLCGPWFVSTLHLRPTLASQARMLLPFVAVLSLYAVQIDTINSVLIGLGRLDLAMATLQASRLFTLALAASLLSAGVGVISLPIANFAGNVFLHLTSLRLAHRITHQTCFRASEFCFSHLRGLMAFGSGVLTSSVLNFLLSPLNKFTLTRYGAVSSVPVYDMAFAITMQIRGVLDSGFASLMPEVSRLKALHAHSYVFKVYRRSMSMVISVGLPVFGSAAILAHVAFQFWLGKRFRPELVSTFRALLLGGFVSLVGVPSYYVLMGMRRTKQIVVANALQGGVNALVLGCLCYAGAVSAVSTASAAAAGLAGGGVYLLIANRQVFSGMSETAV